MSGTNSFKFVLPPQSDTTRDWAKRLAEIVSEARVIVAEDADTAAREIADAEAAFGWLGNDLLLKATKLRWLQAPQAAPPAGYYYPELIAHSVVVTNFREIFNDHIGAHILAFVLAFARGLHMFIPQQFWREWKKSPTESGDVVHLPEATALIEHSKLCEKSGPARPIAISARRFFQRNRRPHAPVAACAGACSLVGIPPRWHLHPWRRGAKK